MNSVFETVCRNTNNIVIKVNADDPLTVAMHPYISSNYAYVTLTRKPAYNDWDYILTVTKKDGDTFSFHWGISGYTLVSESLEELRLEVIKHLTGSRYCGCVALESQFYLDA